MKGQRGTVIGEICLIVGRRDFLGVVPPSWTGCVCWHFLSREQPCDGFFNADIAAGYLVTTVIVSRSARGMATSRSPRTSVRVTGSAVRSFLDWANDYAST